jgi:general secretion pathway protein I
VSIPRERGYALLEVIVAFAIMAGALLIVFGTMSQTAAAVAHSRDLGTAAALATSLLAESGTRPYITTATRSGMFDERFEWHVATRSRPGPAASGHPAGTVDVLELREIRIEVSWSERGMLQTYRLAGLKPDSERERFVQ